MGMDLSGPAGGFFWDVFSWPKLLRVARSHGWEPAGTSLGEEELAEIPGGVWSRGYLSNDFQVVAREDAERLAAALERALPDIPDADVLISHWSEEGGIVIAPGEPVIEDREWFCGTETKGRIRAFIQYCRAGAFSIG